MTEKEIVQATFRNCNPRIYSMLHGTAITVDELTRESAECPACSIVHPDLAELSHLSGCDGIGEQLFDGIRRLCPRREMLAWKRTNF